MKNHDLKLEQHMFSSISSACFQSAGGEALPPCFTHGFGRSSVTHCTGVCGSQAALQSNGSCGEEDGAGPVTRWGLSCV